MLTGIVNDFAAYVRDKCRDGFLSSDWVCDGYWIDSRWLHGAFWGAFAQAVPKDLMVLVEPSQSCGWKPDLVYIDAGHNKVAVIEYESSNSSDERVIQKDLRHYREEILSYRGFENHPDDPAWTLPKLWMIVSTLPSCPVKNWPWHGYNRDLRVGPSPKSRSARDQNPLAYYQDSFHQAFQQTWNDLMQMFPAIQSAGVRVVWVNVDQSKVQVMNENGKALGACGASFPLFPDKVPTA